VFFVPTIDFLNESIRGDTSAMPDESHARTADESARITVDRRSERDIRDRQVVVSVDGKTLGTLLFGQSLTTAIAPGRHWLRAHNTLVWKTVDFDLAPGEQATFEVVNRAGFGTYALSILGSGPLYLDLARIE
jgi:hypothetical protein